MAIISEVFTYYGWIVDSAPYKQWAGDLDYNLPTGFKLLGVDSKEMVIGVCLFASGSSSRPYMEGNESFTQESASSKLAAWDAALDDMLGLKFFNIITSSPRFYTFVDHS